MNAKFGVCVVEGVNACSVAMGLLKDDEVISLAPMEDHSVAFGFREFVNGEESVPDKSFEVAGEGEEGGVDVIRVEVGPLGRDWGAKGAREATAIEKGALFSSHLPKTTCSGQWCSIIVGDTLQNCTPLPFNWPCK